MLFDFNMPKLNGIGLIEKLRFYIKNLNLQNSTKLKVKEPQFVIMTNYSSD